MNFSIQPLIFSELMFMVSKHFVNTFLTSIQAILFLQFESRDLLSKRCLVSLNTVLAENAANYPNARAACSKQLPPTTVEKITETVN